MERYYYINKENKEEGPHDLVTIMRRIRTQVITPDTLVFRQGEEEPVPARLVPDLVDFFNRPVEDLRQELGVKSRVSLVNVMKNGWHFISEHQMLPVLAGAVVLLSALVIFLIDQFFGEILAVVGGFVFFIVLQSYFLIFSLRFFRGQSIGLEFIEQKFAPLSGRLAIVSLVFAVMIISGFVLLVIPALLAMAACLLMPLVMMDYNSSVGGAFKKSFAMLKKLDSVSLINIVILMLIYIASILLILPIPLLLPIIAGGMCRVYEDISAA